MIISSSSNKKICIHITTYKQETEQEDGMEDKSHRKGPKNNKFVCAICLNAKTDTKNECCKKLSKSCPVCQKNCETCVKENKREKGRYVAEREKPVSRDPNVKTVQTSETNVAQGLSLLNEVLTVFQNKKGEITKEKVKSALLKDAAVSTDPKDGQKDSLKGQSKLTVSTFHYSIDESKKPENGKFTIVNCCQPIFVKKSNYSIDLIKHKSSSIPQMKLEELKYSLKEKSRSKDAIEEVNRMFATVRKPGKHIENSNRPVVRSGPRVLPVVKNNNYKEKTDFGTDCHDTQHSHSCKCCQTYMSSGDSFLKPDCNHDNEKGRCDKCVYMLCCHYENKCKRQTGMLICEHCRTLNDEHYCQHENYVDDSC